MARGFGGSDRIIDSGLGSWFFLDDLVGVAKIKLIVFAACIALGVALTLFLARSRQGQAIRATAQEPCAAEVLGIDTRKVFGRTYALNAGICGVAGSLRWPIPFTPMPGFPTRSAPSGSWPGKELLDDPQMGRLFLGG